MKEKIADLDAMFPLKKDIPFDLNPNTESDLYRRFMVRKPTTIATAECRDNAVENQEETDLYAELLNAAGSCPELKGTPFASPLMVECWLRLNANAGEYILTRGKQGNEPKYATLETVVNPYLEVAKIIQAVQKTEPSAKQLEFYSLASANWNFGQMLSGPLLDQLAQRISQVDAAALKSYFATMLMSVFLYLAINRHGRIFNMELICNDLQTYIEWGHDPQDKNSLLKPLYQVKAYAVVTHIILNDLDELAHFEMTGLMIADPQEMLLHYAEKPIHMAAIWQFVFSKNGINEYFNSRICPTIKPKSEYEIDQLNESKEFFKSFLVRFAEDYDSSISQETPQNNGDQGKPILYKTMQFLVDNREADLYSANINFNPTDKKILQQIEALKYSHPNFVDVVEYVLRIATVSMLTKKPMRIQPICLKGKSGIGKSHFARALSEAMNVPKLEINMTQVSCGSALAGVQRSWSTRTQSMLTEHLQATKIANPVVIIDNGNEAKSNPNGVDINAVLARVIDAEDSRSFVDACSLQSIDLSQINWIFTEQNLSLMSEKISKKLKVFEIYPPAESENLKIASSIFNESIKNLGLENIVLGALDDISSGLIQEKIKKSGSYSSVKDWLADSLVSFVSEELIDRELDGPVPMPARYLR